MLSITLFKIFCSVCHKWLTFGEVYIIQIMCMFSANERLKYETESMQTFACKCWGSINRNRDFTPSFSLSCFQLYLIWDMTQYHVFKVNKINQLLGQVLNLLICYFAQTNAFLIRSDKDSS